MKKDILPKGYTMTAAGLYRKQIMVSGKRIVLSGHNLAELKAEVEKMQYEIKNGLAVAESGHSFDSWFPVWLDTYKVDIKAGTRATYKQIYKDFIAPSLGKKKIKSTKGEQIQALINDLMQRGYSFNRINMTYIVLNQMLTKAKALKYINSNPMAGGAVSMPSRKRVAKTANKKAEEICKAITKDQLDLFMDNAKSSVYRNLYVFLANTGCRVGEATGLRWNDIDFVKNEIHISNTMMYLRGKGRVLDSAKCDASIRTIPMTTACKEMLKQARKEQLENQSKLGKCYKVEAGLENMVFQYPEGGALWNEGVRKDMNRIIDLIRADGTDFPHITPHSFRHSFATKWLLNGLNPKVLQGVLGHSDFGITMNIYGHCLDSAKADNMEKFEKII